VGDMLLNAEVWMMMQAKRAKEGIHNALTGFFKDEQGDTNMISIIIILVIVVALAIVFRKNIAALANNLWNQIFQDAGKATNTNPGTIADPGSPEGFK